MNCFEENKSVYCFFSSHVCTMRDANAEFAAMLSILSSIVLAISIKEMEWHKLFLSALFLPSVYLEP